MSRARSTVVLRRLLPGILAATVLPATAFAALVVAVPGASATSGAALALTTSLPSASVTPSSPGTPGTSPFPPSAPSNLTAAAVTTGSVTLTWTASTMGCCSIVGYNISYFQSHNDIGWNQEIGNVTSVTITANVARTRQYSFSVTARDSMGRRSAPSNTVVVVTPNTDTGDTSPPSAPTPLTVSATNGATASLAWPPSTDDVGVTGYDVYYFDGVFNSWLIATVAGTSYTATLSTGRNVFYVRARDAAGNLSIASNNVNVAGVSGSPPVTTGPPVTTSPPVTPGACVVTYANSAQWSGGFVASVTIRNASTSAAIDGWTLTFAFAGDQRVTTAWGARVTQAGTAVTARNQDWNRRIPVGSSVTFGMQGAWSASNAAPAAFALNGNGCVVTT